jgi:hypothetical protein
MIAEHYLVDPEELDFQTSSGFCIKLLGRKKPSNKKKINPPHLSSFF